MAKKPHKPIMSFVKEHQRISGMSVVLRAMRGEPEPPARHGAPTKFEWDSIDAEIRRRLSGEGPHKKRDDFINEIQEWYRREFRKQAPSKHSFRPHYARLRKQLASN
jgi:hypothetical protein